MSRDSNLHGLLAEFDRPEALMEAANRVRKAGYRRFDAYTPFPVEGLAEAIGFRDSRVPWLCFLGGILGALLGYAMQAYVNIDFPIDVGGRAVLAVPAFMVVTFELTVLFAVLVPVVGMLVMNGLPRLNHPLFEADRFHLASIDRFFLCIESRDAKFDPQETAAFLESLDPRSVMEVPA